MKELQTFQPRPLMCKVFKSGSQRRCRYKMFVRTYPFQLVLYSCVQISSHDDANACYEHQHTDYYGGIDQTDLALHRPKSRRSSKVRDTKVKKNETINSKKHNRTLNFLKILYLYYIQKVYYIQSKTMCWL